MRLTTDANDSVTLQDIITGHRAGLQAKLSQAELSEDSGKESLITSLQERLQKLDEQSAKLTKEGA